MYTGCLTKTIEKEKCTATTPAFSTLNALKLLILEHKFDYNNS